MAPPYTAYTYGDPSPNGMHGCILPLGQSQKMVAPQFNTNSYPYPTPVAKVLQGGVVGTAYTETIDGVGGTGPYTFALSSGSLPAGLGPINSSTGVISGTPSTPGTYTFYIQVTDSLGGTGTQQFQITIVSATVPPTVSYTFIT